MPTKTANIAKTPTKTIGSAEEGIPSLPLVKARLFD
jgi:hypothetical protein